MNYQHAFHAGNHADVLKHTVLVALCEALTAKPTACFALDTHAGQGLYQLDDVAARTTGESSAGIGRLQHGHHPLVQRYWQAVAECRLAHGPHAYPGSPWLLARLLRQHDRIACCELADQQAGSLRSLFAHDARVTVYTRDGYSAIKALVPPRTGTTRLTRGLVLIDPPYETQAGEFDTALAALRDALQRWPQGMYALWYPIKQRRTLQTFYRRAAALPGKAIVACELLVRRDDSPLRLNGSGMLLLNPPWQIDTVLQPALAELARTLGDPGYGSSRLHVLRAAT